MARIRSATALGFSGLPAELLHTTEYVVMTTHTMVIVEAGSDMLDEIIRILQISGETDITVFKRDKIHLTLSRPTDIVLPAE